MLPLVLDVPPEPDVVRVLRDLARDLAEAGVGGGVHHLRGSPCVRHGPIPVSAAGIPLPALWILPDTDLNAFATGRDPARSAIAVTEGLLDQLNRDELQATLSQGRNDHRDNVERLRVDVVHEDDVAAPSVPQDLVDDLL
ncbi:MAG: M48 family metalloprotease [Candidatus Sumerlaeia bacterium]|nr:M48 family metalloprotease [Candidatus Sumerlaeia bacterium]